MRTGHVLVTISFVIIFVAVFAWLAINSMPANAIPQGNSISRTPDVPPVVSQVTPLQNGASLVESHCARCHTTQWLKQTRKSRTEWENTLAEMERMDGPLSDSEKGVLLDYLAITDEP